MSNYPLNFIFSNITLQSRGWKQLSLLDVQGELRVSALIRKGIETVVKENISCVAGEHVLVLHFARNCDCPYIYILAERKLE